MSRLDEAAGKVGNVWWAVAFVLASVWAFGVISSHTAGGFIHILIVPMIAVLVFRMLKGRGNQGA